MTLHLILSYLYNCESFARGDVFLSYIEGNRLVFKVHDVEGWYSDGSISERWCDPRALDEMFTELYQHCNACAIDWSYVYEFSEFVLEFLWMSSADRPDF